MGNIMAGTGLSADVLRFGESDVYARALLNDLKAMDKHKGSLSSDVIAQCRVLNVILGDDERHISAPLRDELLEWIVNRLVHFGGYDLSAHAVIGLTLFELSGANKDRVRELAKRFETEKERAAKAA